MGTTKYERDEIKEHVQDLERFMAENQVDLRDQVKFIDTLRDVQKRDGIPTDDLYNTGLVIARRRSMRAYVKKYFS